MLRRNNNGNQLVLQLSHDIKMEFETQFYCSSVQLKLVNASIPPGLARSSLNTIMKSSILSNSSSTSSPAIDSVDFRQLLQSAVLLPPGVSAVR
jgi:hypothetical protein